MKKFIRIALPTGHIFEVLAQIIADNRAAYYHGARPEEFPTLDAAMEDTVGLFDDSREIREWALNNMDMAEIEKHARLIRYTPPEIDWDEADWSYHDAESIMSELDGETLLKQPIEMALNAMASARQICHIAVMGDQAGKPYAALAIVQGGENVVGAYVNALQFVTNQIASNQQTAMPH